MLALEKRRDPEESSGPSVLMAGSIARWLTFSQAKREASPPPPPTSTNAGKLPAPVTLKA
jgi:hypothetical protein